MADVLESMMRRLDGSLDHLDSAHPQLPESLWEDAAAHKKSLLDVAHLLGPSYEQNYINHSKELDRLRAELQSIAHERVVVDVLTRQSIKQARNKKVVPSAQNKEIIEVPYEPIVIPSFAAYSMQQSGSANPKATLSRNAKVKGPPRLSVRSVTAGSLMVPSMRQGVLPPEVANLKTTPTDSTTRKKR